MNERHLFAKIMPPVSKKTAEREQLKYTRIKLSEKKIKIS